MTLVDHVPAKYHVLFLYNLTKRQGPFRKGHWHRIFFFSIVCCYGLSSRKTLMVKNAPFPGQS